MLSAINKRGRGRDVRVFKGSQTAIMRRRYIKVLFYLVITVSSKKLQVISLPQFRKAVNIERQSK